MLAWARVSRRVGLATGMPAGGGGALGMLRRLTDAASAPDSVPPPTPAALAAIAPPTREPTSPTSRRVGALGMKCGMSQAWAANGALVPLTIIELQDVQVMQIKMKPTDCTTALKIGAGWQKHKRLPSHERGQFEAAGIPYKEFECEFPVTEDAILPVGTSITARHFVPGQQIDVQGISKGKGFQGVVKRWGMKGQPASHGHSLSHRSMGSAGGAAGAMYNNKIFKGKKMAGNMGNKKRTVKNLIVHKVDPKLNLVYVKGSVPGPRGGLLRLQDARLKWNDPYKVSVPFPTFLPGDPGDDDPAPSVFSPDYKPHRAWLRGP